MNVLHVRAPRAAACLAAGALALGIAACGSSSDSGSGSAGTTGGGDGGSGSVGVTVMNATNPFFKAEEQGAEAAGKALGIDVKLQNGNQDVAEQSDVIDSFIQQKVAGIVIDPVDTDAVGPAVKRATDAGIPVVAIDNDAKGADATLTTDNVQAGRISCRYLGEQLRGEGAIALLNGTPISAVADRIRGCREALADFPGIEIVADQRGDNGRDKGLAVATDILTAHPEVRGFFAINDPTAAGIELAAKQKGRDDIVITSVDGAGDAIDSIRDGGLIRATAAQDPIGMGRRGVELARELAAGRAPARRVQLMPTTLVTADNADTYRGWD